MIVVRRLILVVSSVGLALEARGADILDFWSKGVAYEAGSTIEAGFQLPAGALPPADAPGMSPVNATALFGRIAFVGDKQRTAALAKATTGADPTIAAIDLGALDMRRLVERVEVAGATGKKGAVELRTDAVAFPVGPEDRAKGPTHVLIASIVEDGVARLVSAVPVERDAANAVFDPRKIGAGPARAKMKATRTVVVPNAPTPAGTVVMNDNDWPPFFFGGRGGERRGAAKEILEVCLPTTGRKWTFRTFPIKRMRRDMESGDLDTNIYSYEKVRDEYVHYAREPIFRSSYMPIVRADSTIKIEKIADFDGLKLGHLNGLSYSPEFKAYIAERQKAGTLDVTDSEDSNLKKLLAGRFDIYVNSTPTVLWLAKTQGLRDKIKVLDFPIKRADYFVTMSKASKHLPETHKRAFMEAMDGCLRQLKKDGTHAKILAGYGLDADN